MKTLFVKLHVGKHYQMLSDRFKFPFDQVTLRANLHDDPVSVEFNILVCVISRSSGTP